jgi:hypothetical protein
VVANENLTVEELNTGLMELLDARLAIQAHLRELIRHLDERLRDGDPVNGPPYVQGVGPRR